MEYFTFGMETMRITQNYDGIVSHYKHSHGTPADYPIDIAGKDNGRSAYFATVDMKVVAKKGIGTSMTNTIWLETLDQVITPSGNHKVFIALTHWNDKDSAIARWQVDGIVKKGQIICYEGTDGTEANHLHMICGYADKGCGKNLIQNNQGAWVSDGDCRKPEEIMYINKEFTQILDTANLKFQEKPKETSKENFLGSKGYFSFGDTHENIAKIAEFMYKTFSKYTSKKALGNYYGKYIQASIKEFQKRTGLEQDGCIGPITLAKLKEYGFSE